MAQTEGAILQNYLLLPAPLPAVVTLQEFAALFPKSQQAAPLCLDTCIATPSIDFATSATCP